MLVGKGEKLPGNNSFCYFLSLIFMPTFGPLPLQLQEM